MAGQRLTRTTLNERIPAASLHVGVLQMRHLVGFGRGFLIHSKRDMISCRSTRSQTHQPAACSWKLRVRVAVTAAVRLCLFAVTLQWSTQLSAVCLTAERHTATLVRNEIVSLPPIRCHPHRPPNSTLWWIPIKCSSPSAARRSFPAPPSTPFGNALKHYNHASLEHFPQTIFVWYQSRIVLKCLLKPSCTYNFHDCAFPLSSIRSSEYFTGLWCSTSNRNIHSQWQGVGASVHDLINRSIRSEVHPSSGSSVKDDAVPRWCWPLCTS